MLFLLVSAALYSQKVENVLPEIDGEKINIYYDLKGLAQDEVVKVSVYMSTDGGKTYGDPLQSVTGDVGLLIGPGIGRCITWDVFSDLDQLVSVNVKFKVRADPVNESRATVSGSKMVKLNLNSNIGYRNRINYGSFGFQTKGMLYLDQLGIGIRADYYKAFREPIDYTANEMVFADTGYYWGYSAGFVLEYDLIMKQGYSLYPFIHIGQAKFNYSYNPDYLEKEYFAYSVFGSIGAGYDMTLRGPFSLGIEMEYMVSPWIDIIPSGTADEAMDCLSVGVVLKFILDSD